MKLSSTDAKTIMQFLLICLLIFQSNGYIWADDCVEMDDVQSEQTISEDFPDMGEILERDEEIIGDACVIEGCEDTVSNLSDVEDTSIDNAEAEKITGVAENNDSIQEDLIDLKSDDLLCDNDITDSEMQIENAVLLSESTDNVYQGKENKSSVSFEVKGTFGGRNVTFNTEAKNAKIYYSSTTSVLDEDNLCVNAGETVLFENFYGTIYARTYINGNWGTVSRLILKIPVINDPEIKIDGNIATITTSTPLCYIYYTTDGTEPSLSNGTKSYGSKAVLEVSGDTDIKAIAVRSCFTNSSVVEKYIPLSPPSFNVKGIYGGRNVSFSCNNSNAVIYYSTTTSALTTYDDHILCGESINFSNYYGTLYAKSYINGKWSNVSRLILKIPTVNTPQIEIENKHVKIIDTTPNSIIFYTTDGTEPSMSSKRYNGEFDISITDTVKAIAVRSCFSNSNIEEKSYMSSVFDKLKEEYPEGTPFTNDNKYYWRCVGLTGAGCYAFAGIVSDSIFGTVGTRPTRHTNLDKIKIGDHLRINNTHSVIVMKVEEKGIVVTEGNYNSSVHWGRYIPFETIKSETYYIETRYWATM